MAIYVHAAVGMWVTILSMSESPDSPSIEQKHFKISVQVAVAVLIFLVCTVAGAAAWAQDISSHLTNVDTNIEKLNTTVKDLNVILDRSNRMEERLQRLEEWRLQQVSRR